ncbi:Histidine kinase-, DNA gyrase B-, and HSP90-like ATPase [Gaiella occulta]|uniref:histidine kinase n=1 Tax=Gaiella occulta TaxID=1002870 RepID=A0A7M2Z216_9ACTN|nr:ATP-binding protein [Gaiella occulta]RDI76209.1 Histidine kinase-, DNA gyrase B-, and HSP90-like ATPase [Gaiella occulta]
MRALSRLPIRLRLTLAFAVVMAIVLTATGLFVYVRLRSALDQALDASLRSRADDVAALVLQSDSGLREGDVAPLSDQGERFAQVVDRQGRIVDATRRLGGTPLLTPAQRARAQARPSLFDIGPRGPVDSPSRLLATPITAQDRRLVVIVGASLEARDEALRGLVRQFVIGGPVALLLASLAGYGIAAAALAPVESMRSRASLISGSDPSARLPVPASDDEIRRLGETLNAMLERLEQTIRRERTFVADASHELRTPLASLKTELELALRRTRSADEMHAALHSAADETDRLWQLAEDMLVLARSDDGRLPLRVQAVDAADVLEGVAARFADRAALAGRTVSVDSPRLAVRADPLRLEQALGNLVDNALRHGRGTVRLAARRVEDAVELHVGDDGPGFPAAYLPRAFERFSRASEARERGGAGLGLAIVEVVARAHGGTAHATNNPLGGADVWIAIPGDRGVTA